MVEECCKFVDQAPDLDTKLKLIDTLRTVSEGKVRGSHACTHEDMNMTCVCMCVCVCPREGIT